jgi:hypothetical protein
MQVDIFTACDFAEIICGKVVLSGTFHDIQANAFPVNHSFSVVLALSLSEEELKTEQRIGVKCVSPSENVLFEQESKFGPNARYINFVINARDIPFPSQGVYRLLFYWDGKVVQDYTLNTKIV